MTNGRQRREKKREMGDNLSSEMMHFNHRPLMPVSLSPPLGGPDLDSGLLGSQMFPPRTTPSGFTEVVHNFFFFLLALKVPF